MCLVALALDPGARFPLVVAANRDEYFHRPTARLGWWTSEGGAPAILGGRDLAAGGTWMGLTAPGRLALVTNVRDPARNDPAAPSRGRIVPDWLATDEPAERFWARTAAAGYNGFNLVAFDFRRGDAFFASSHRHAPLLRLERGLHGLSNASLDTPWPKVVALKARMRDALAGAPAVDALAARLFEALGDATVAADADLPRTGIPLERERQLSAAFIRTPDGRYGTRSSMLVIVEQAGRACVTHVLERTHDRALAAPLLQRATLADWPPRGDGDGDSDTGAASAPAPGTAALR